jgi:S1-C subfamily serine protease
MGRVTLYSSSNRSRQQLPPIARGPAAQSKAAASEPAVPASDERAGLKSRLRGAQKRFDRPLWLAAGAIVVLAAVFVHARYTDQPRALTQEDIDGAVLHTLQTKTLPSTAARAYDIIKGSVVRVRQLKENPDGEKDIEKSVGSGVVIVDKGVILTNLHVVAGADRVGVVFADGTETEAEVIGMQPENDLAVIQAKTLPDDLEPATLRSTRDLAPGDEVVAVGFPFGIGPSATAGVISGLGRNYVSPDGRRSLSNLIQFDAAVNPGSSGGPLVTADGEVVGIVTGIMNPTEQRVFVGIGFAVPIENAAAAIGMSPF